MSYCSNCKITNMDNTNNCPLCGKELKKDNNQPETIYPKYIGIAEKREPIINILEKILLWALVICLVIDLFITKTLSWSLYVLASLLLVLVIVLQAIKKKNSLAILLTRLTFWLSLYMIFIEFYTNSFGWGIQYAIPSMWLGFSIIAGIATLARGYVNFEMFKPMIMIFLMSLITVIVLLCIGNLALWANIASLLVAASEIILMFMFRFKRSIRSLKRDFGI